MKEDKDNCIFCKILEKKSEASIVYEDEHVMAFMDIQPVNPGHILVIPREHIPYLEPEHTDLGAHLFRVAIKIKEALKKSSVRCEGINYLLADGEAAGQEVFHAHLHIFPRFKNDGFGFRFSESYYTAPKRKELDKIATEIKGQII